jgi:uncharacterized protein (DUF302 family)
MTEIGDGLKSKRSRYGVAETADRTAAAIARRGGTIFSRLDYSASAAGVGLHLRPTEILVFGNPRIGTLLMQCSQTAGIDLPLRILVWEDESREVYLTYNDPAWIALRHGGGDQAREPTGAMAEFLKSVIEEAADGVAG